MLALSTLVKNRIKNGRYFLYEKDTTDLANVYTFEGSEYISAPNPIYCVDGLPDNTYFVENRIYDLVAQEYLGDSSDPQGDLRPEMWHEEFSTKVGFEYDPLTTNEDIVTVKTIENLKQHNVGGFIKVIGYWDDSDCEERVYMWDSNCVNTEDGGLIIASEVSDTGRWILICNEIMKSEYYGVYGNSHQEHLGSLFGYNDSYGSMGLVSPKTIMLAPGSYGDGYSLYNARGKKVIFSFGAKIKIGNTLRCASFEGINPLTGVLGNIQIGFNEMGQWSEDRANQPVRLSTYNTLDDFLNSWSKYLIFDVEGAKTLIATKTLEKCYCVFEKSFQINTSADQPATLIFNNCTINSEGKITDAYNMAFKNMVVSDKWFADNVLMYPDHSIDTGNSLGEFKDSMNYWRWLTLDSPSAVTADFNGMKTNGLQTTYTANGLSAATIRNLNVPIATFNSIPNTLFENCNINSAYIYSPNVEINNCIIKNGMVTANGNGNSMKRKFYNSKFGSDVAFTMENATAVNISAIGCDFGSNHSVFVSNNGLDLGEYPNSRGRTYFVNNVGLGDNYNPKVIWSGAQSNPASLVSGIYQWYDVVGSYQFNNGFVSYKVTPGEANYDGMLNTNATAWGDITYKCDYQHPVDGKTYNMDVLHMVADFGVKSISQRPFIQHGPGDYYFIRLGR